MILARPALPERYQQPWRDPFDARIEAALTPGVRILDIGAGRKPTLALERRPPGCHYAGLDISDREFKLAPPASYDEIWVRDASQRVPELEGRFDLIVSWNVFEHIRPLESAIANAYAYLRPGGRLVTMFAGTFSAFGVINTVVPQRVGVWAMHRLLGRDPDTVFPAYYDHCWQGALKRMFASWGRVEIIPHFRGAGYFGFSSGLQRAYLAYEDWAMRNDHSNLATHYVVSAIR